MRSERTLLLWLWSAQWQAQPGRLAFAALSIAIGVALALAIHLVNRSALGEFGAAIAIVNGQAQAQVVARARELPESVFSQLAELAGVHTASPIIEASFAVEGAPRTATGSGLPLRVIGLDPMRAAAVTPALVPSLDERFASDPISLFADDAIFLSEAALRAFDRRIGQTIRVVSSTGVVPLRIAGTVSGAQSGQMLAVMDIAAFQWRLGWLGRISRVDLRFERGADVLGIRSQAQSLLPQSAIWAEADASEQRMSNLSRAYRVNLNVLALVALLTGAFIVNSALSLLVVRQQAETALLGVLGAPRRLAAQRVLGMALAIGALGSGLGVLTGIALAAGLLATVGGDLGGGYFSGSSPSLSLDMLSVLAGFAAGLATALVGALAPMRTARGMAAARALRSGSGEDVLRARARPGWSLLLFAIGCLLLAAPPIDELPIAAYAAIALWLLAGILLVPSLTAALSRRVGVLNRMPAGRFTIWLAAQRLAGAPGSTAAALSGVVASVALASAMAIMVTSFRTAVSEWLDAVLPADLYARVGSSSTGTALSAELQTVLAQAAGVRQVEFMRLVPLTLAPHRPPVTLIARPLDESQPARRLPITGELRAPAPGEAPVWISEAMTDLYGVRPGDRFTLPIATQNQASWTVFVAGVWRDYSRQHGSIAVDLARYREVSGDQEVNEVAWWLLEGTHAEPLIANLRARHPVAAGMEFREASELRALSLRIFDRSFAITYALEAVAILVALFGVASTCAGEALARAREFGMLRHLGMTRRSIGAQFAAEAALGSAFALAWGMTLGAAIAWVLVHRVNPQSFHWTMAMDWPIMLLGASALALMLMAALAARIAAREAMSIGPVRAVREDW
jgi:putative ABC transport system permease protein